MSLTKVAVSVRQRLLSRARDEGEDVFRDVCTMDALRDGRAGWRTRQTTGCASIRRA
jgi:hypothetical protein